MKTTSTAPRASRSTMGQGIEASTVNSGSNESNREAHAILEQIIGKFRVLKGLLAED